ncbi:hypothetical protein TSARBOMBA_51 [Bacillus phage TsarBomba]|uniref:Uncharacterized protein n=1 Tax=Bacillus phage TsarBomba TaxID=1690456 RepID=A0A0K2D0H3_9CAUD|nr:hypothetical protein TSARBOMBA_51 [Bacillus phage TsarBomba]ALA13167.1 hypothetical protein TSARBOMBA_51 [Bacillus phage TsarBomba]
MILFLLYLYINYLYNLLLIIKVIIGQSYNLNRTKITETCTIMFNLIPYLVQTYILTNLIISILEEIIVLS